jgi:hypothetical protein
MLSTEFNSTRIKFTKIESGPSLAIYNTAEGVLIVVNIDRRGREKTIIVFVVYGLGIFSITHDTVNDPLSDSATVVCKFSKRTTDVIKVPTLRSMNIGFCEKPVVKEISIEFKG